MTVCSFQNIVHLPYTIHAWLTDIVSAPEIFFVNIIDLFFEKYPV